jgi:hypothetical protein
LVDKLVAPCGFDDEEKIALSLDGRVGSMVGDNLFDTTSKNENLAEEEEEQYTNGAVYPQNQISHRQQIQHSP